MALLTLDFGQQVDILNKRELEDALRQDAALRSVIMGVKYEEAFYNVGVIGASAGFFATPVNMVAAGLMWAVMNIGLELSASQASRIYKGAFPVGTTPTVGAGQLRMSSNAGASTTPNFPYSKGQLSLRHGEQLTIIPSGSANILTVFITAISIPSERFGELLV